MIYLFIKVGKHIFTLPGPDRSKLNPNQARLEKRISSLESYCCNVRISKIEIFISV